ncbi:MULTISPECIES: extensin [unclassified Burkholderia]|uniref:extensin n=1 Tax=unclassified Burkholderia TaxID=2613784 RepID=UPI001421A7E0|nr:MULTISPECIES: extensin [unclassified Burkholderia]NIE57844.1 extensin [Burkholderia sp. Ap-955]NIF09252.1 extensin [Burkholderia sp. Ax-1735]NIG03811.1 extensin [Burkholderia sp. Tr-849]
MTSTRKTLMIAGGLLVAAAGTAYVMLLRADHRAIEDAGIGDSAAPVAAAPAGNDHAVQGAIAPPAPAAAMAPKQAAVAPSPPAPAPSAPVATARVNAAPAVPVVSDKPQPVTKPAAPPPKVNVVTVDAQDSTPSSPPPAAKPVQQAAPAPAPAQVTQRASRKRDGLERHAAAAPFATKSETPETAALVRESAKLDPSLPPPSMSSVSSMPASTGSYRQGGSSSGANPVAAAMTEQLVRQSSSFKSTAPAPADGGPTATK